MDKQVNNSNCPQASTKVRFPWLAESYNRNGFFRKLRLLTDQYRKPLLCQCWHPCCTSPITWHWPDTRAKDVCTTWWEGSITGCIQQTMYTRLQGARKCVWSKHSKKHRRHLQLILVSEPVDLDAMYFLERLLKTSNQNQFLSVMTDRYSKLIRAAPTSKISAAHIALMILDHWIIP